MAARLTELCEGSRARNFKLPGRREVRKFRQRQFFAAREIAAPRGLTKQAEREIFVKFLER